MSSTGLWKSTKASQTRASKGCLRRAGSSEGVGHQLLRFGRDSKPGRGGGKPYSGGREGSQCALMGGRHGGEAGGGLKNGGICDG